MIKEMCCVHVVYMLIQCTPLLVEKADVAPDVTVTIHRMQASKSAGERTSPSFKTHGDGHTN